MSDLAAAFCLVMVLEGVLPFISPATLRRTAALTGQLPDRALRLGGLASMLVGLLLLQLVR
ncbi:MAG: DUF2065 domain-containing protein [Immundisolibacter sp.]|uniref:DUF2065 domain-containing protein n=1 Tax=Immundisolibacter sp. TaxID=1934948 RepID=UPI0035617A63